MEGTIGSEIIQHKDCEKIITFLNYLNQENIINQPKCQNCLKCYAP